MDFNSFSRHLFVFAHPDDEIYTCAFIEKLATKAEEPHLLYVTSGDYQGTEYGPAREEEARKSARLMGVPPSRVHFLRIPERQLMSSLPAVVTGISQLITDIQPDCIVSHDFEGGHNGHDAVSFCTSQAAILASLPLYVFPAYRGWPEKRVWNQFLPGVKATETLDLTTEQQKLQDEIIAIHSSQADFFNTIRRSSSNDLLSMREVVRYVGQPIDYSVPPESQLGYEYPGSKLRFDDFKSSVLLVLQSHSRTAS